ncbi:MAG: TrkA family potassium uptake protein [Acutalibacteraceae bacterium]|nr:TrkA family potassium uptake protein [Acutalibacteraceae bacterium]
MKSILLIGVGQFGKRIALKLSELNHEVMAIDRDEERVNDIAQYVSNAQIGDSTNQEFLESLGINNFDVCIVAIGGDFQSSLETASLLKELGAKLVVARAEREVQEKFLLRNGADEVVNPEKQVALWTAVRYSAEHLLDFIQLDGDNAIFEVEVPKTWLGKTIKQIDIRRRYNVNIMAVKKNGKMNLTVTPDEVFDPDETIMVVGSYKDVQKCFHI